MSDSDIEKNHHVLISCDPLAPLKIMGVFLTRMIMPFTAK